MVATTQKEGGRGVSLGDIVLVTILAMAWFFLVQVSSSFVIVGMMAIAWFMVSIYVISRFTGFLSYIKLLVPTWTMSYLISLPIWFLLFAVLPEKATSSSIASTITEQGKYLIDKIIPIQYLDWIINSPFFAITESLIVVFLVALFFGVAYSGKKLGKDNKSGQLAAIFLVAGFASMLHTGVALMRASSGDFSFTVVLIHQLIAFFVMIILGLVFGAPGVIAPHMAKNDIVYAASGLWWVSLLICILLDIISLISAGKSGTSKLKKIGGFT